jgi:hypothetical protein
MRTNLIYLIAIICISNSCGKINDIPEDDETQMILDSLSQYPSFIYFETIEDTIYDTNFQLRGFGSSSTGVETDSVNINIEFGYENGIEDTTATLILIFRSKEIREKIGSYGKYKYFEDYCEFFDTGNLYFANYTKIKNLHRGIQFRYHNSDTNDDIENYTEYNTLTDEDVVLSHSDFNFQIYKSKIFYEEQILELYYTFNCELALLSWDGGYLGKKLAFNNGHGKMTIAFYHIYP